MSAGLELVAAAEWLDQRLSGDAELAALAPGGVHVHPVPRTLGDAVTVTFSPTPQPDSNANGAVRVLSTSDWLVRVSGPGGSPAAYREAYARVDALLHGARCQTVTTGVIESCHRTGPFWLTETEPGNTGAVVQWAHLGGFYRIIVTG